MTRTFIIFFVLLLFHLGLGIFGSILFMSAIPKFTPFVNVLHYILQIIVISFFCFVVKLIYQK